MESPKTLRNLREPVRKSSTSLKREVRAFLASCPPISEGGPSRQNASALLFGVLSAAYVERAFSIHLPRLKTVLTQDSDTFITALHYLFAAYKRAFDCSLFDADAVSDCTALTNLQKKLLDITTLSKELSLADLCTMYEEFLSSEDAKKQGVFYTPAPLAEQIAEYVITQYQSEEQPRILDLSCGAGMFLLKAYQSLRKRTQLKENAPWPWKRKLLEEQIFGVDLDYRAVEAARFILLIAGLEGGTSEEREFLTLRQSLLGGHSLVAPHDARNLFPTEDSSLASLSPLDIQHSLSAQLGASGGFDIILGNPPFGLSRGEKLLPIEKDILEEKYSRVLNGRINKYILFIARTLELLRPGGTFALVIPNSFLGVKEASKIRKLLLQSAALHEIWQFKQPLFERASIETIVIIGKKDVPTLSLRVKNFEKPGDQEPVTQSIIPYSKLTVDGNAAIPILWSHDANEVINHLIRHGIRLAGAHSHFEASIALQAYATGKGTPPQSKEQVKSHCFHSSFRADESYYPYLEGKDITPFQISWSGAYLSHGEWLAEPQKLSRFQEPRIVIREILAPLPVLIRAAYITETFLYNKSVLHIRARSNTKMTEQLLQGVCLILNSSLTSFQLLMRGRKSQRTLFPKIVVADLGDLLLPAEDKLRELVSEFQKIKTRLKENSNLGETVSDMLQNEIDRTVYAAYGLSAAQITVIESFLSSQRKEKI